MDQEVYGVYMVGGAIRDEILGVPNKDIDFAVEATSYEAMREFILDRGRIYLETPEFFTIRAKLYKDAHQTYHHVRENGTDGK
jgi:tRNA nucleotidyltransferase/poly(A) polymerase